MIISIMNIIKMKTISFILFILLIISCSKNNTEEKWMYYYNQYFSAGAGRTALDSAIFYIDEKMKDNPEENWSLYCYKLMAYSILREYDKALSTCFNDTIVIDGRFPFLQSIFKERFQAMKAHDDKNIEERDHYLMKIMETISNYMNQNGHEMAELMDKQNTTEKVDGHIILLRNYYFCKTIVDGKDAAIYSLDSLYNNYNNMGCYDDLKNYINNCSDYSENELMNFSL